MNPKQPAQILLRGTVLIALALVLGACLDLGSLPAGPKMEIDPSSGPSGTQAKITISGAQPNAPVTLDLDPGSASGTTDANGNFSYDFTFFGQVGDISHVKATIGSGADEETAKATFEITGEQTIDTSNDVSFADDEAEGGELKVTCDPDKGPSGTSATITVSGGEPNQPVTLQIGQSTTSGTTDANGNFTYDYTFFGQVGEKITVEATVGPSSDSPKASTTFEITAVLDAIFHTEIIASGGDLSHAIHIDLPDEADLHAHQGSLTIESAPPWVNVAGELNPDGSFSASGSGTVAGYPGIHVTFEGTISLQHLEGEYSMGTGGGLPGGQPIIYSVTGENVESQTSIEGDDLQLAIDFFDTFNQLQAAEDSVGMFKLLHPAVLNVYGEQACSSYLASIVNPGVTIMPVEVTGFGPWDWVIDGRTTSIQHSYTLQVQITTKEGESTQEVHIAQRPDGSLGWFTDCGDPLD